MGDYKVDYWKNGRYAIFFGEKIVDDAQGFGYKDRTKANKAMWWKFGGGKEKKSKENKEFKVWFKDETNKKIVKEITDLLEWNIKELARNEITVDDIFIEVGNNYNIEIPQFVKSNILNA